MSQLRFVLIADDSASVRLSFRQNIEAIDQTIQIIEAKDGIECADALSKHKIDIAFIDINMPGMSGLEALKMARSGGNDSFVVLMSGQFDPQLVQQARRSNAYDYLKKPFNQAEIQRLMTYSVKLRHQTSILVVDDSKTVRRVVFKVLNGSQFNLSVSEADSGKQAVQLCRSIPYDIIFMDYHMPGLSGLEGAKHIVKVQPRAKIILMSSDDSDEITKGAKDAGLAGFMKKPFYPQDVDMVLHEIMGLKAPSIGKATMLFPSAAPKVKEPNAPAASAATEEDDDAFLI